MGLAGSKRSRRRAAQQGAAEATDPDPLAKCVANALKAARSTPGRLNDLAFDKLLLKFPTIRRGFKKLPKAFHHPTTEKPAATSGGITGVGGPTGVELFRMSPSGHHLTQMADLHHPEYEGTLSPEEAKRALVFLGLDVPQAELEDAFADVETPRHSMEINYSDFVVGLCVLVLRMGAEKARAGGADAQVVEAIQLSLDSFAHFDKDGNGYLFKDEVLSTLAEVDKPAHAPSKKGAADGPLQERWQQMDCDHDGRVGLREYLMALHSWVMEDLDEDED